MTTQRTGIRTTTAAFAVILVLVIGGIGLVAFELQPKSPVASTTNSRQNASCESPISARQVPWHLAVTAILGGQATCMGQSHNLSVILLLANGSKWATTEPAIDDMFQLFKQCGSPCANMTLWTE
jgi:hypothetical protein